MKKKPSTPMPLNKTPTANDVARYAGVSRTQVSEVLGGKPLKHVSPERRERILSAAKDLGYRPQHMAQSLRRGYSSEFSIFFPAPYASRVSGIISTIHIDGLAGGCVAAQYSWNKFQNPERMLETFHMILARRPLGLFCSLLNLERKYVDMAKERGIEKILVLDVEDHEDIETLYLPVREAGFIAAQHLLDRGHRRIAVLRTADMAQARAFLLRFKGFQEALAAYPDASIEVLTWPQGDVTSHPLTAAREIVARFVELEDRPTAIYAYIDDYAFPLLRALNERGFKVPEDVAVLGTDDLPYGEISTPSLSTVKLDETELGERTVAKINALITGDPVPERFLKPPVPHLVEREST